MGSSENGSEQSMEDILASIRRIIADDPPSRMPPPARNPAPSAASTLNAAAAGGFGRGAAPFTPTTASPAPANIQLPVQRDILTGSAGATPPAGTPSAATPAPPQSTSQRARLPSIDEDLADLIEAPAQPPVAARDTPTPGPVEAARQKWANLINPAQVNPGPTRPAPAQAASPAASDQSRSPTVPLPPIGVALGTMGSLSASTSGPSTAVSGGDKNPSVPATEAPADHPGPNIAPPQPVASSGPFMPRRTGFYPPAGYQPPAAPAEASDQNVVKPTTLDASELAPQTAAAPATSVVTPVATIAPVAAASDLDVQAPAGAPGLNSAPTAVETPASNPVKAAEEALDALAAGLAKVAPRPEPSANPSAPVPEADHTRPTAGTSPAVRTLEDVVADMMRPMLAKWLDENMPRIVERALRNDAAAGVNTGPRREA